MKQEKACKAIDLGKAQQELEEAQKASSRASKVLARAEDEAEGAARRLTAARETLARGTKAVLG